LSASQNLSPKAIETNRDAGVIIESPAIAQHFEPIFLSDWAQQAKPFHAKGAAQLPKPKAPAKKPPVRGKK
jgi:phosphatidylserine/phosphatidylglycerophosphate/cardiolipin synthase-like enzyme